MTAPEGPILGRVLGRDFCASCDAEGRSDRAYEYRACVGGYVFGPCELETCPGVCEYHSVCGCQCHEPEAS